MSSSPAARRLVSALHSLREFVSPARLVQVRRGGAVPRAGVSR